MHIDFIRAVIGDLHAFCLAFLSLSLLLVLNYNSQYVKQWNNQQTFLCHCHENYCDKIFHENTNLIWIFKGCSKFRRHHFLCALLHSLYDIPWRLKAKLTATLILYLNAYLLHEYRSNTGAIAKFLDFINEMVVNNIRVTHLSSPSFCTQFMFIRVCSLCLKCQQNKKLFFYTPTQSYSFILICWKISIIL